MTAFAPAALRAFWAGTPAAFLAVVTFAVAAVVAVIALAVTALDTLRTLTVAAACTLWADTVATLDTVWSIAVLSFDATETETTLGAGKYCAARNYWDYAAIIVVVVVVVIAPRGRWTRRGPRADHYWRASICVLVISNTAHTMMWLRTARALGDHS